jgi:proteasome lid subunit RPN8/RPN11
MMKKSENKSINMEIGGEAIVTNKRLRLMNTAQAYRQRNTGRLCIQIPTTERVHTWHMHPKSTLWWPSSEDMLLSKHIPSLLVSRHGIWLYTRNNNVFNKERITKFTNDLTISFFEHVHDDRINNIKNSVKFKTISSAIILDYMKKLKLCGIDIFFIWKDSIQSIEDQIIKYLTWHSTVVN